MPIIISETVRKNEFRRGKIPAEDALVLFRTARINFATLIKGADLPKSMCLLKAYGTSPSGAKRVVYLISPDGKDFFLLFYRNKNDGIGGNVTVKNPKFRKALRTHLAWLKEDYKNDRVTVLPAADDAQQ